MIVITEEGRKDVPITQVTKDNYIVPENEKHLFHCVLEVKQFDRATGKRISVPRVQKFGEKIFLTNVYDTLRRQGYDIIILHDPQEYNKELEQARAKAAENMREAIAQAKAEAEKKQQEAFEKAVAQAVEARLAQMKKKKTN